MPVTRYLRVARGPRALKSGPSARTPPPFASGIIFPFTLSCRTGEAGRQNQGGTGGIISDLAVLPKNSQARLRKTRCTGCITCTTGIAFNGGSESRLLMPVGRAPDVARGPRALKSGPSARTPPSPFASVIIFPFTLSCRTDEAGRQNQGGAGEIISDLAVLPKNSQARLRKTCSTLCGTCTTGIAFNGGSESRLLMPVGRAPDVARGPRALKSGPSARTPPRPLPRA